MTGNPLAIFTAGAMTIEASLNNGMIEHGKEGRLVTKLPDNDLRSMIGFIVAPGDAK